MRLVAGFPRCMVFPAARNVIVSSYSRFSTSTVVAGRKCSPSRNSRNCSSFSKTPRFSADYFPHAPLGELMPQRQVFGKLSAFLRQVDPPPALHAHVAVARHAFQGGGHRGRSNFQFLGKPRADGCVVLFQHLPDRLQIVFLRYACLFSPQLNSYFSAVLFSRFSLRPSASWFI